MFEKIKGFVADCGFFSKKTYRAAYFGVIAWALSLIVLGMPVISSYATHVTIVAMCFLAAMVEAKSGKFSIFEFAIDIVAGATFFGFAKVLLKLEAMASVASHFSIPRMSTLLAFILVAMVAQTEIRFKPESGSKEE